MLKRLGIVTFMERSDTPNHRGQAIAHISFDDLESLRQELASRGVVPADSESEGNDGEYVPVEIGVFYLIQLEPEHDSGRFKVGFAVNIAERLRAHRCAAPFAVVIKTWPARVSGNGLPSIA
jgi:hypothetical protein